MQQGKFERGILRIISLPDTHASRNPSILLFFVFCFLFFFFLMRMLLCPSGSNLAVKLRVIADAATAAETLGGIFGVTAERPLLCWPLLPPVFGSEEMVSVCVV